MRQLFSIIILCVGICSGADAQTFTQRLQKKREGQGTVNVYQDAAIDELVNGPKVVVPQQQKKTSENKKTATEQNTTGKPDQPQPKAEPDLKKAGQQKEAEDMRKQEAGNRNADTDENDTDTRKKVMRNSYKATGYRVQAYAGGNTRLDRQKAEQTGNNIKANYPDEPIYVHFYSPRWICRVGNYRTYEEAHQMLQNIRKLGYKQASIVKGKISIQY
jgi:hypothetical protein